MDLRYGARGLRRQPEFLAAAVLSLGLESERTPPSSGWSTRLCCDLCLSRPNCSDTDTVSRDWSFGEAWLSQIPW